MNVQVINRGKLGWALEWHNGMQSYMPDKESAYLCAAAAEMRLALLEAEDTLIWYSGKSENFVGKSALKTITEALGKSKP